MPSYQIAHVREQGQDIIFVPVASEFARLSEADRNAFITELQQRTIQAGLAGIVVPCFYELARWHFFGPTGWKPFFESTDPQFVPRNINRTLSWRDLPDAKQ